MAQGRIRRLVTLRRVRRSVLCIVLGGAMTVAAAWAAVLLGGPLPSIFISVVTQSESDDIDFEFSGRIHFPSGSFDRSLFSNPRSHFRRGIGPSGRVFYDTRIVPRKSRRDYQYGFPFRAMTLISGDGSSGLPWVDLKLNEMYIAVDGGIDVPSWLPARVQDRRLPLGPMWPGFLYSTLVYGAFAWLLMFVPSVLQRRLRLRHGLCQHCAYPLGSFAVCPECGNPTGREA